MAPWYMFGENATRLLAAIRARGRDERPEGADGLDRSEASRIRDLIDLVETSDVGELSIEDQGVKITVRRQEERGPAAPVAAAPEPNGEVSGGPTVSQLIKIESPMVGTFYRSPSPAAEPFVEEGDRVEVGQTLCILEAMKLFNELKSEQAGVIRTILVSNAEPVEFGQPLFELEP